MALNRIKAIFAEKQLTSKWPAKSWGKLNILFLVGVRIRYSHLWKIL